jgi:hypothetical protein
MNPRALPVDVLETHLHDVACPKPQAGEQNKYGPIPFAYWRGQITGGNETLYIFQWQVSR